VIPLVSAVPQQSLWHGALALAAALRLWRRAFPLRAGVTWQHTTN